MRLLFGTVFALVIAAAIGLGGTWVALTRGSGVPGVEVVHGNLLDLGCDAVVSPANSFGDMSGGIDKAIDDFHDGEAQRRVMAAIAEQFLGELPVGSGDGVAFYASTDDAGQPLDGRCDVLLSGTTPQARFWTLTLYDPEGRLVANSAQRQGFTSQEIIRNADGSFNIMVGPRARPGNWLPTGGVEKYLLVLRLYDTPIGMAARTGSEAPMPAITKKACL